MIILWETPVPSTSFIQDTKLEMRGGREVAVLYSYESEDEVSVVMINEEIIFTGVEAFKVTYYNARDILSGPAYDKIVDCGETEWYLHIIAQLNEREQFGNSRTLLKDLVHLMINFDDGPCYEIICHSFVIGHGNVD